MYVQICGFVWLMVCNCIEFQLESKKNELKIDSQAVIVSLYSTSTNKEQLTKVVGGVSGAVLSTIVRGFKLAFDMGRHLGSSIRRFFTRNYC